MDYTNAWLQMKYVRRKIFFFLCNIVTYTYSSYRSQVGRSVRSVHLTVETPPVFDPAVNVKEVFSWNGKEVNLTCTAEAIPNATIFWTFNNKRIERSDQYYTWYSKGSPNTLNVSICNNPSTYSFHYCHL